MTLVQSTCSNMVGHTFRRFDKNGKMRKNGRQRSCLTCGWEPKRKAYVYDRPGESR
jgi:hypothetical protein